MLINAINWIETTLQIKQYNFFHFPYRQLCKLLEKNSNFYDQINQIGPNVPLISQLA